MFQFWTVCSVRGSGNGDGGGATTAARAMRVSLGSLVQSALLREKFRAVVTSVKAGRIVASRRTAVRHAHYTHTYKYLTIAPPNVEYSKLRNDIVLPIHIVSAI